MSVPCEHNWVDLTIYFSSGKEDHIWKDSPFDQECTICKSTRTVLRDYHHRGSHGKGSYVQTLLPEE